MLQALIEENPVPLRGMEIYGSVEMKESQNVKEF